MCVLERPERWQTSAKAPKLFCHYLHTSIVLNIFEFLFTVKLLTPHLFAIMHFDILADTSQILTLSRVLRFLPNKVDRI